MPFAGPCCDAIRTSSGAGSHFIASSRRWAEPRERAAERASTGTQSAEPAASVQARRPALSPRLHGSLHQQSGRARSAHDEGQDENLRRLSHNGRRQEIRSPSLRRLDRAKSAMENSRDPPHAAGGADLAPVGINGSPLKGGGFPFYGFCRPLEPTTRLSSPRADKICHSRGPQLRAVSGGRQKDRGLSIPIGMQNEGTPRKSAPARLNVSAHRSKTWLSARRPDKSSLGVTKIPYATEQGNNSTTTGTLI